MTRPRQGRHQTGPQPHAAKVSRPAFTSWKLQGLPLLLPLPSPSPSLPSRYEDTIVAPVLTASIPAGGRLADRPYTHKAKVASLSVLHLPLSLPASRTTRDAPEPPGSLLPPGLRAEVVGLPGLVPMSCVMFYQHSSFEDGAVIGAMAFQMTSR